jgi:hypothetical protein
MPACVRACLRACACARACTSFGLAMTGSLARPPPPTPFFPGALLCVVRGVCRHHGLPVLRHADLQRELGRQMGHLRRQVGRLAHPGSVLHLAGPCRPRARDVHPLPVPALPPPSVSYPGMLSAFARLQFPHLFHASVSSSAPVQPQLDFAGYNGGPPQPLRAHDAPLPAPPHPPLRQPFPNVHHVPSRAPRYPPTPPHPAPPHPTPPHPPTPPPSH